MGFKRLRPHAQHLDLGGVGIGDKAAVKHI
jgi:hypothetical protein